ncbi:hypothetical protein EDB89DRAFT_1151160 [Lactarius sanguifluus]|nr:hypothetical protein EDB89DRAFT_1151160 [Lactarius sanguifluus]
MAVFASLSSGSCGLDPPPSGFPMPGPPDGLMRASADLSARMQQSIDELEAASQDVRFRVACDEQSDKTTAATYRRHVNAYAMWWDAYQASILLGDPTQVAIPAFPITAAKATMFLEYTSTRPKRRHGSSEEIPGSVVGASVIKQTISALEYHRAEHQYLHTDVPEAQIGLRLDRRIHCIEVAAQHNEPKRIASAQALKASGSSSDTYTVEDLKRCSLFCLTEFSGRKEIFVGLRDRAMLLLSTSTALRGGSCRAVELSDLFPATIPSPGGGGSGIEVRRAFYNRCCTLPDRSMCETGTRHPIGQRETQPDWPHGRAWGHPSPPCRTLSHQCRRDAALGDVPPQADPSSRVRSRLLGSRLWGVRKT